MANIDAKFGLRPYERSGSNYNNQGVNAYPLNLEGSSGGTTNTIFTGSPVIPLTSGMIDQAQAQTGGNVPLLGVFMGCKYTALDGTPTWSAHWPGYASIKATTEAIAYVADNPHALFVINADDALPDGDLFKNAQMVTAQDGNTTSGYSSGELDATSAAAANPAYNLKIVGFDDQAATNAGSVDKTVAGRLAVCKLNVHFMDSTAGI